MKTGDLYTYARTYLDAKYNKGDNNMDVQIMAQKVIKVSNEIYFMDNEDDITNILSELVLSIHNEGYIKGYEKAMNDAKNIIQQNYHENNQRINKEYGIKLQKFNQQLYGIRRDIRNVRW